MKYEKYKIPPDFGLAQIHSQSCKLFKQQENQNVASKCGCCNQFVGQDGVSVCQNISNLRRIGEEVPLFFNFVFLMILLIIFILVIKSGEYLFFCDQICDSQKIKFHFEGFWNLNFNIILGYINEKKNMSLMIEIILYSIIIVGIKIHLKTKKYRYRTFNFSIEKRSVQLLNLPKNCTEKQIRKIFKHFHIEDVVFTFQVRQYHKCMTKIAKLKKSLRYFNTKMIQNQQNSDQIKQLEQNLNNAMRQLQEIINNLNNKKKRLSIAFVVFQTINQRNQVLKMYASNFFLKIFKKIFTCCSNIVIRNQHITVEPATAPDDIKWENLQNPYLRTKIKRFLSFITCAAVLLFGLLSEVIILNFQNDKKDFGSEPNQILSSVIIFLLNFFIINFLEYKTNESESHISNTNIKRSLIRKITFFMFFNVSISPFFIMLYNKITTQKREMNLFSRVTLTILIVSFGNFFKPLFTVLSVARFRKWLKCIKQKSKGNQSLLNQLQANQLFQPLDFPIQIYYSLLHASLMMSFFYLGCFQILILIQLPSILMLYIIAKWMLTKVCKQPRGLSTKLSNLAQSLMRFYIPLYWFGSNSVDLLIYSKKELNFVDFLEGMIYADVFQIVSVVIVFFMLISEKFVSIVAKKLVQRHKETEYQQLVDHNRTYRQANLFFKIHEQDFTRITVRPKMKMEEKYDGEEESEQKIEINLQQIE